MTRSFSARLASATPSLLAISLALLAAPGLAARADTPTVLDAVGGNSANNQIFYLDFADSTAVRLDASATARSSVRSFEFFKNSCAKRLDLVAADTNRSELLLYENSRGAEIVAPCDGGLCPQRPDGLSSSNERLMAVAQTGAAGSVPSVWFYAPETCDNAGPWPFKQPVDGGRFMAGTDGATAAVGGIADTEFVKVLGGGLDAGDLLVITSNPATISRVPRDRIAARLAGTGALGAAEILADASHFGSDQPTAMAFVPGTAGIGADDGLSESEDLLVTLSGGKVLKLTFKKDRAGNAGVETSVFLEGLGNGALGIAAGTRDDDTFMLIADRNQGKFLRYTLDVANNGDLSIADELPATIESGVQNPQGVAFNSDAYDASRCEASAGGCRIRRTVELEFTQSMQEFSTLFANIFVVPDTRGGRGGTLKLSDVSSEFNEAFEVPPSCVGFPLPDDAAASVLVVINVNNDVEVEPGQYVQTRELVNNIIPQLGACTETGARLFYHPDPGASGFGPSEPEQGVLYDTTYACVNPSRSISRAYSPIVICADAFYGALNTKGKGSVSRKAIQSEVGQRIDFLQVIVHELEQTQPALAATLSSHLSTALNLVKRSDYPGVSNALTRGAELVAGSRDDIVSGGRATLYGDLLGRFLALAFFTSDSLSGGQVPFDLAATTICSFEPGLEGCQP